MNVSRGFTRIWIALSVAWVGGVAILSFKPVIMEFQKSATEKYIRENAILLLPVNCEDARGDVGIDYRVRLDQPQGPWDRYANPSAENTCWYEAEDFRRLWPEYADLADVDLSDRLYEEYAVGRRERQNPWQILLSAIGWALLPPIGLLVIGRVLGWIGNGFRS